jgi:coenzyme PQQ synthesis protein D (PqqD)
MPCRFAVNAPSVVSEIIDGEVIIMNLKSGNYYSSDKLGAVVWSWIEEGKTEPEMTRLAALRYRASPQQIGASFRIFFDRLMTEDLVRQVEADDAASAAEPNHTSPQEDFVAPELCTYTDMQDLLLLDPIHEVNQEGWPQAKERETSAQVAAAGEPTAK